MRVVWLLLAALGCVAAALADEGLPTLKATRPVVSVREGTTLHQDSWTLAPDVKPDIYEALLPDGLPLSVTFISDVDSLQFQVEVGQQYDFVIRHGNDLCETRIVGVRAVAAASFDAEYQAAHKGKISVEVPEVYELVNVAIAMTPTGMSERNLVYHDSDYYAAMRKWFDPHQSHPLLAIFDAVLKQQPYLYANLKMNGYSFEFNGVGRIVQSRVYDRTAFPNERSNSLRPFLTQLQSFADTSRFREFYQANRTTYAEQIAFYKNTAGVEAMRAWLNRNFPDSPGYDSYKIVFSPLVAYSQSSTWLENNGFRELQAHVNYPYPRDVARRTDGAPLSKKAETVLRSLIVFTELNHGYINPEADKYSERIMRAISRRDHWVDSSKGPNYYGGISTFNEYMNWSLVSLRAVDLAPRGDQQTLIKVVDDMMTKDRGFPRFAAFDAFLVDLYRNRKSEQTVAELYPQIIKWFEKENAAAPRDPASSGP
jgi:hypothetical protein